MGLMSSISNTLFGGGSKQVSTLTPEQLALLNQQAGLQQGLNPTLYSNINNEITNPTSSYSYDNGQAARDAFQTGIVDPARAELNRQIGDTMHSSNIHSSANRAAIDNLKTNTMNNLNNLNYQDILNQQKLEQEAEEQANQRKLGYTTMGLGQNQNIYGTQSTALQKQGGLLDAVSGIGSVIGLGKNLIGGWSSTAGRSGSSSTTPSTNSGGYR